MQDKIKQLIKKHGDYYSLEDEFYIEVVDGEILLGHDESCGHITELPDSLVLAYLEKIDREVGNG